MFHLAGNGRTRPHLSRKVRPARLRTDRSDPDPTAGALGWHTGAMSSLRLGRVLGIPVEIHWSIVAVVALFTGNLAVRALPIWVPGADLRWRLVAALVGVILFFASILAHELGHSMVAMGHGVGVSGITLWLLGGMAQLDEMVPTARAEARIAAAGPAVSGILAVFFTAVAVIGFELEAWRLAVAVAGWLGFVNLILALFNLAPAAPLDGGRILTAALWHRTGDAERARLLAGRCGLVLAALLVVGGAVQAVAVGPLEGVVTAVVGLFVFQAARIEIRSAVVRRRLMVAALAVPVAAVVGEQRIGLRRPPRAAIVEHGRRRPLR